jgi:hypothetical protein
MAWSAKRHPVMAANHVDGGIGKKGGCAGFCFRPVDIGSFLLVGHPIIRNQMQIYRQAMAMIADAVGQSALERLVGLGF